MHIYSFLTLKSPSQGIYKEKGSKFLAFAYPVKNSKKANHIIKELKRQYHNANHHCYAYLIDENICRENDDGEPSSTAGRSILKQIQSFNLQKVLVVVVRYFGGVKLGIGGLINAYRAAARNAIDNAEIVTKHIEECLTVTFSYSQTTEVMRLLTYYRAKIRHQYFTEKRTVECHIRKSVRNDIVKKLEQIAQVS